MPAALAAAALLLAAGCAANGGTPPVAGDVPGAPADASPPLGTKELPMTESTGNDRTSEDREAAPAPSVPADPIAETPSEPLASTLELSARAAEKRSSIDAPLRLHVEARNASSEDAELLLWNTAFERVLSADVFRVSRDGEPVEYQGRLVKRAPPPGDDAVVRLAPGETLSRVVDLAPHYAVDVPGTYTVELDPARVPVDDGAPATARFAALVPVEGAPVAVERR